MPPKTKRFNVESEQDKSTTSSHKKKKKKHKQKKKRQNDFMATEKGSLEKTTTESSRKRNHNNNINKKRNLKENKEGEPTQAETNNDKHSEFAANPLREAHQEFLTQQCPNQERDHFFSNALVDPDRRATLWMEQADLGEELVNQHAWAIPDARALRILRHFSPLIEIGCGANAYWARLLSQSGVDIVAYDMFPGKGGKIPSVNKKEKSHPKTAFQVRQGGPEVLASKKIRKEDRTLFLCYCDEDIINSESGMNDNGSDEDENESNHQTSLGVECLKHYTGDYIIHVGELYGDTLSQDQAPWGRSSGPLFQQQLAATFHCLLKANLPNWLHVRDSISVWKRTETCSMVFAADEEDSEDEDEEMEYRHIPPSERLPADIAAPCLAHLLLGGNDFNKEEKFKSSYQNNPEEQSKKHKANNVQEKTSLDTTAKHASQQKDLQPKQALPEDDVSGDGSSNNDGGEDDLDGTENENDNYVVQW